MEWHSHLWQYKTCPNQLFLHQILILCIYKLWTSCMLSSTGIQLETIQKSVSFESSFPNNYKSDSLCSRAQKLNYSKTLQFWKFWPTKIFAFHLRFCTKIFRLDKKKRLYIKKNPFRISERRTETRPKVQWGHFFSIIWCLWPNFEWESHWMGTPHLPALHLWCLTFPNTCSWKNVLKCGRRERNKKP